MDTTAKTTSESNRDRSGTPSDYGYNSMSYISPSELDDSFHSSKASITCEKNRSNVSYLYEIEDDQYSVISDDLTTSENVSPRQYLSSSSQKELAYLRQKIIDYENCNQHLIEKTCALTTENEHLQEQYQQMEKENKELNITVKTIQAEMDIKSAAMNHLKQKISQLNCENQSIKHETLNSQCVLTTIKKELELQSKSNEWYLKQMDHLHTSNCTLDRKLIDLQTKHLSKNNQIKVLVLENHRLKQKVSDLNQSKLNPSDMKTDSTPSCYKTYKITLVQKLKEELRHVKKQLNENSKTAKKYRNQLKYLKLQLSVKETVLDDKHVLYKTLENAYNDLLTKYNQSIRNSVQIQQNYANLKCLNTDLILKLAASNKEKQIVNNTINDMKINFSKLVKKHNEKLKLEKKEIHFTETDIFLTYSKFKSVQSIKYLQLFENILFKLLTQIDKFAVVKTFNEKQLKQYCLTNDFSRELIDKLIEFEKQTVDVGTQFYTPTLIDSSMQTIEITGNFSLNTFLFDSKDKVDKSIQIYYPNLIDSTSQTNIETRFIEQKSIVPNKTITSIPQTIDYAILNSKSTQTKILHFKKETQTNLITDEKIVQTMHINRSSVCKQKETDCNKIDEYPMKNLKTTFTQTTKTTNEAASQTIQIKDSVSTEIQTIILNNTNCTQTDTLKLNEMSSQTVPSTNSVAIQSTPNIMKNTAMQHSNFEYSSNIGSQTPPISQTDATQQTDHFSTVDNSAQTVSNTKCIGIDTHFFREQYWIDCGTEYEPFNVRHSSTQTSMMSEDASIQTFISDLRLRKELLYDRVKLKEQIQIFKTLFEKKSKSVNINSLDILLKKYNYNKWKKHFYKRNALQLNAWNKNLQQNEEILILKINKLQLKQSEYEKSFLNINDFITRLSEMSTKKQLSYKEDKKLNQLSSFEMTVDYFENKLLILFQNISKKVAYLRNHINILQIELNGIKEQKLSIEQSSKELMNALDSSIQHNKLLLNRMMQELETKNSVMLTLNQLLLNDYDDLIDVRDKIQVNDNLPNIQHLLYVISSDIDQIHCKLKLLVK